MHPMVGFIPVYHLTEAEIKIKFKDSNRNCVINEMYLKNQGDYILKRQSKSKKGIVVDHISSIKVNNWWCRYYIEEEDPDLTVGCNPYNTYLSFIRFPCSSITFFWKSSFSLSAFLSASSWPFSNRWIFSIRFWILESWYATRSSIAFISSSLFALSSLNSLLLLLFLINWWKRPRFPKSGK